MHGKTGERPNVDIVVVQVMHPLIEWPPMVDAVDGIEMQVAYQGYEAHHDNEINRMLGDGHIIDVSIGIEPHCQNFIG